MNATTHAPLFIGESRLQEGGAKLIRLTEGFNVWTKHIGPRRGTQVLTLHGGPGIPHFYLECLEDFLPRSGIGFWYYDQLGCGFSDLPNDVALFSMDRYREEVEQVRSGLGQESVVLFGHSWGAMLAIEYALKYPERVRALVLSNMAASIPSHVDHLLRLRAGLPPAIQRSLEHFEATQNLEDPAYQQLLMSELYRKHICRLSQWPEPVMRALRLLSPKVYRTMNGPDEFHVVGNIKGWDRWNDLQRIEAPTLILGGRFDTMSTADLLEMGNLMPNARTFICDGGSHLAIYDDQQMYFHALLGFLKSL